MSSYLSQTTGRGHNPSTGFRLILSSFAAFLVLGLVVGVSHQIVLAQNSYREIEVKGGGTISGTVRLVGPGQKPEIMEITKDHSSCGAKKPSPRLEVGKSGGVSNTVVYIEGMTTGKKIDKSGSFIVNQEKCEYTPHISIVPQGAQLVITNSDAILHNVHAYDDVRGRQTAFNIAQPIRGQKTVVKQAALAKCGEQISLTCDAGHPWMSGYVFSTPHPYYTVTDKDGTFRLDDVPPGKYKLVMWHEGVAVTNKEMDEAKVKKYSFEESYIDAKEVTMTENGKVTVEFELKLR